MVAAVLAVDADLPHESRQRLVVREQGAAIAVAAKRFRREKRRGADRGEPARTAALVGGAEALRGVLDHGQAVIACDVVDGVEVRALAIQRDRHDGPRPRRDRRLEFRGVHVVGTAIDVDEHGLSADQRDHLGRGEECERHRDDFVAWTYVQRHQRDQQRVGAARHSDAVLRSDVLREPLLELGNLRTHDVLAVLQHARDSLIDRGLQATVLGLEVDEVHEALYWAVDLRSLKGIGDRG